MIENMNEDKNSSETVRLNDHQMMKIKLGLSSLTNTVLVSRFMATLYIQSLEDIETWSYLKRGVPGVVIIFNKEKEVVAAQIVIADPDSGFAVWRDNLNENSCYKANQKNFHTFRISTEESMGGIRFPTDEAASIFLQNVLCNLPNPNKKPKSPSKNNSKNRKFSMKKLRKDEISSPCMFTHVTSVNNKPNNNKSREKSRTINGQHKGTKYSGSGSSIDAPDSDPNQTTSIRRTMSMVGGGKKK